MTLAEMRTEIRALLNDEDATNPRFSNARINNRVNEIHKIIANRSKVLKSSATDTLATDTKEYALPEASEVLDIERVEIVNTDNTPNSFYPLFPTSMEELDHEDLYWRNVTGAPTQYYLRGNLLGLTPYPSSSENGWTLRIFYADKPTTLSADSDTPTYPDQFHHVLLWGVIAWCKREDNDFEESQLYEAKFQHELNKMSAEMRTRKGTTYIMKPETY